MNGERKIKVPTTGLFDFPELILGGKGKYIDKTDLLYDLCNETDQQLFISRPRRFGKSLMLSTLKAMFEGRRELFKGLAIDNLPWEGWSQPTPVYSFTMADANGDTYDAFKEQLANLVKRLCTQADVPCPSDGYVPGQFDDFLQAAIAKSPTKKIVILIDEYDEPVAKFLNDVATLEKVRSILHDFYEKLKLNSGSIRFLMMTGVTKLTKLSVFSGLNHLTDISMASHYATLLGYTEKELDGVLRENVEVFGEKYGWDFETAKAKILEWYDGYRFSPQNEERVVNPVSLGKLFSPNGGQLKSYWETTGSATLVLNRIKASGKFPADLENVRVKPIQLDVCDALTLPMESLLYQGGYLTIKEVIHSSNPEEEKIAAYDTYRLSPPNLEIRQALKDGYISQVLGVKESAFDTLVDRAKTLIANGAIGEVIDTMLYSLYASIPPDWQIRDEAEAKRYFLLFFSMLGANPVPEFSSARGYADAVVETPGGVYVLEFKYNRTSDEAIKQIRERGYAEKWRHGERPVTLSGINFDPEKRNIDIPVVEPL